MSERLDFVKSNKNETAADDRIVTSHLRQEDITTEVNSCLLYTSEKMTEYAKPLDLADWHKQIDEWKEQYPINMAQYEMCIRDSDYITGPKIITEETRQAMRDVLHDIQDGTFAKDWLLENQAGSPHFRAMRKLQAEHPSEKIGAELRKLYSWEDDDKLINN